MRGFPTCFPSQAFSSFRAGIPLIEIEVDRVKAKDQGIPLNSVFGAMQAMLGSLYINDFNLFGRTFRVMVQAEGEFRNEESDIGRIFVRNVNNEMVPLSTLISTSPTAIVIRFAFFLIQVLLIVVMAWRLLTL